MFGSFGWMELLLILIIVLIIFGAGKLPQLGEGLGKAIKGFKKSVHEAESLEEEESPASPSETTQQRLESGASPTQSGTESTAANSPAETPTNRSA
ncbi:twin-arginine translocase TatA/TatE family subunit [Petrachloros mirabilis]